MKDLIDECGQFLITLIIASIMVVSLVFGYILPHLSDYTNTSIPEGPVGETIDVVAIRNNVNRQSPMIIVSDLTMVEGKEIKFNDLCGTMLRAINADGDDISEYIAVQPANSESEKYHNYTHNTFSCLKAGQYKFIAIVKDITGDEYFGKEEKTAFFVNVIEDTEIAGLEDPEVPSTP